MKISEEQKKVIENVFGTSAESVIKDIQNKKGALQLFNADNTLKYNKKKTLEKIQKKSTTARKVISISKSIEKIIKEVETISFNNLSEYKSALNKCNELQNAIENRKASMIEKELQQAKAKADAAKKTYEDLLAQYKPSDVSKEAK